MVYFSLLADMYFLFDPTLYFLKPVIDDEESPSEIRENKRAVQQNVAGQNVVTIVLPFFSSISKLNGKADEEWYRDDS